MREVAMGGTEETEGTEGQLDPDLETEVHGEGDPVLGTDGSRDLKKELMPIDTGHDPENDLTGKGNVEGLNLGTGGANRVPKSEGDPDPAKEPHSHLLPGELTDQHDGHRHGIDAGQDLGIRIGKGSETRTTNLEGLPAPVLLGRGKEDIATTRAQVPLAVIRIDLNGIVFSAVLHQQEAGHRKKPKKKIKKRLELRVQNERVAGGKNRTASHPDLRAPNGRSVILVQGVHHELPVHEENTVTKEIVSHLTKETRKENSVDPRGVHHRQFLR